MHEQEESFNTLYEIQNTSENSRYTTVWTFNTLYEIRCHRGQQGLWCGVAFNTLYEILHQCITWPQKPPQALSILSMRFCSVFGFFKPCCGILFSGSVNNPLLGNSYIRDVVWYLSFRYYRILSTR